MNHAAAESGILYYVPLTVDPAVWHAGCVWRVLACPGAVSSYAFYFSRLGRPLFARSSIPHHLTPGVDPLQ